MTIEFEIHEVVSDDKTEIMTNKKANDILSSFLQTNFDKYWDDKCLDTFSGNINFDILIDNGMEGDEVFIPFSEKLGDQYYICALYSNIEWSNNETECVYYHNGKYKISKPIYPNPFVNNIK